MAGFEIGVVIAGETHSLLLVLQKQYLTFPLGFFSSAAQVLKI